MRQWLGALDAEALAARSAAVAHRLEATPEFRQAEIVMVFLSHAGELDTTCIVLSAWRQGKRVLAPKVSWEQRRMLPLEIRSLTDDVIQTELGSREPVQGVPIPVADIDMVLVPGLSFDRTGHRVGRGRGFYDRFLSHRDFSGVACGLGFQEQLVETIEATGTDQPLKMLVTDETVIRF